MRNLLPDNHELMKLVALGETAPEIAQTFGVSRAAVYKRLKALGYAPGKARDTVMEAFAQVHHGRTDPAQWHYKAVKAYARRNLGDQLGEFMTERADDIADHVRSGLILEYTPEGGWGWRERSLSDPDLVFAWPENVPLSDEMRTALALPAGSK
jgi:hypothetical protein